MDEKIKNILITGSAGFIGRNLFNRLQAGRDFNVFGITRGPSDDSRLHPLDLNDSSSLELYVRDRKIDVVFHLAGRTTGPALDEYLRENVLATQKLLEAVKDKPHVRTFLVGSAAQYGTLHEDPVSEESQTSPRDHYGLSKELQERLGEYYRARYDMDIVFLRIFNAYGEDQSRSFIVPKLIERVLNAVEQQTAVTDIALEFTRDFIYLDDLTLILEKLIHQARRNEVYNIASGRPIRVSDITKHLCRYSGKDIEIVSKPAQYRESDIVHSVARIDKLLSVIGDFPFTDFFTKLEAIYDRSFQEHFPLPADGRPT